MMTPQRLHIHHSCTVGLLQWCPPILCLRDLGQNCNAPRHRTYGFADLDENVSIKRAMDGLKEGNGNKMVRA
jgi:hypothetical protein